MLKSIYSTPLHGVECFVSGDRKKSPYPLLPLKVHLSESSIVIPEQAKSIWQHSDVGARYKSRFDVYLTSESTYILDVKCEGVGRFQLSSDEIKIDWQQLGTDSAHYFQTIAIALYLELNSVLCIHANALEYKGKTIALIGPSGMGKSTLSSYCMDKGFNWLTDDMMALHTAHHGKDKSFMTYPSWPVARMWTDSIEELTKKNFNSLNRVHAKFNKREIKVPKSEPTRPRELHAIYLLNRRDAELNNSNKTFESIITTYKQFDFGIHKVHPSLATIALIQNSILGDAYKGLGLEHQRFQSVTDLVNKVPVYIINYNTDYSGLDGVYEQLLGSMRF